MKEKCSQHGQPLVLMCLQCGPTFFCLLCDHQTHHLKHCELIDISEGDRKWLKYYEAKYETLLNHPLFISPPNHSDIIAYNEKMVTTMIGKLISLLEEKRSLLIKDVRNHLDGQAIKKQLSRLKEKLLNINFRTDDLSELAKKIQHFQQEISPKIQKTLQSIEENIKKWKIDPLRASRIEKPLEEFITESLNLDNLFSNDELKFFKRIATSQKGDEFLNETVEEENLQLKELIQLEVEWKNEEQLAKELNKLDKSLRQKGYFLNELTNLKLSYEFGIGKLKSKLEHFGEKSANNSCYAFNSFRTNETRTLHDSKREAKNIFQNQSNIKNSFDFGIKETYSSLDKNNKADPKPTVPDIDQLGFPQYIPGENINKTYLEFSRSDIHQPPEFCITDGKKNFAQLVNRSLESCIVQQPAQFEQGSSSVRESISTIGKYSSKAYVSLTFETLLWQINQARCARSQTVEKVSAMESNVNLIRSEPDKKNMLY